MPAAYRMRYPCRRGPAPHSGDGSAMIVRSKLNWFRMIFAWRGSILPKILPRLTVILILGVVAVPAHQLLLSRLALDLNIQPFTLVGIALAIFLGFRNTVSYDRYWEARRLWGQLLNVVRALGRQALTQTQWAPDGAEARRFVLGLAAFSYALKHQLRRSDPAAELKDLLPAGVLPGVLAARFRPMAILLLLGQQLGQSRREDRVSEMMAHAMERNLDQLAEVVGGCERIQNTPIPMPYAVLLHRTVYVYCMLLPFGLASAIGWLTPLFAVFISYTFIALDAIADEIEEPFGVDPNDLPLNTLSLMIKSTLLEMLGDPLPPLPEIPRDYVLL